MEPSLEKETQKLLASWTRHDARDLCDYLVADVQDPRINVQSILTRHFLADYLFQARFRTLMCREYRFAVAMELLMGLGRDLRDPSEVEAILHALGKGADNAEGIDLPRFLVQEFSTLPAAIEHGITIPNYIESVLRGLSFNNAQTSLPAGAMETFAHAWRTALSAVAPPGHAMPSVLEPACGSANDYRFLDAYGLASRVRYTGFDLCPKNVENARALFPKADFRTGNAFDIEAEDKSFDLCLVHDFFEHLSLGGMGRALEEVCRVTRSGLCLHFFNMAEIPEHREQPLEDYHWNLLSVQQTCEALRRLGFNVRTLHIGTFLRTQTGWGETHNPSAFTLFAWPQR